MRAPRALPDGRLDAQSGTPISGRALTVTVSSSCAIKSCPRTCSMWVPGRGSVVGQALAANPQVKMMSFTGSTKAGSAVAQTAAGHIPPALLELGGKNAFIVFDDADVDRAVRDALEGGFYNKGEACTAA